ncbi:olfactory receptor 1500-like [Phyllobates terribilis]|uniref:olfactory receptor 1500-like n=1 Tax=Phyllobates terribilis TaxID=111132 RepID=UPI003CCB114D
MENESMYLNVHHFILLGLREMEHLKYLYSVIALVIYLSIMFLCTLMVYVVWAEASLHEPMYIFICNLMWNDIISSSSFLPKLAIDLLSGWSTISFSGCLIQSFGIQSFAAVETLTFTLMAFDRYLAVGFPLRYHSLMTNRRALQGLALIWLVALKVSLVSAILVVRLTICGNGINSVYCETMSLTRLSCVSTVVNDAYGTFWALLLFGGSLTTATYCYIRTFLICLKISMEASQKAIHTLVTHILTFFTFMMTVLFVSFRYRLNGGSLSAVTHLVISIGGPPISMVLNPLIYGIRTRTLKTKMISNIKKEKSFFFHLNPLFFLLLHTVQIEEETKPGCFNYVYVKKGELSSTATAVTMIL